MRETSLLLSSTQSQPTPVRARFSRWRPSRLDSTTASGSTGRWDGATRCLPELRPRREASALEPAAASSAARMATRSIPSSDCCLTRRTLPGRVETVPRRMTSSRVWTHAPTLPQSSQSRPTFPQMRSGSRLPKDPWLPHRPETRLSDATRATAGACCQPPHRSRRRRRHCDWARRRQAIWFPPKIPLPDAGKTRPRLRSWLRLRPPSFPPAPTRPRRERLHRRQSLLWRGWPPPDSPSVVWVRSKPEAVLLSPATSLLPPPRFFPRCCYCCREEERRVCGRRELGGSTTREIGRTTGGW